jgi:hypothetical protein
VQVDSGVATIPIERIAAAIFNPSLVETPQPRGLRAWIGLEDDGLLLVEQVRSQSGMTILTLPGGLRLQTDDEGFRGSVQLVQPLGGKATYLSDLPPLSYRHIPYLTLEWDYALDRNVLGGRLRVRGQVFVKGLGMHSASRIAYRLDGKAARFRAQLAVDDAAGRDGSVIFRVYTAGADGQFQPAYESRVIRGGEPPTPISVNIAAAKAIALIVEHADRGDMQDYADWIDARVE